MATRPRAYPGATRSRVEGQRLASLRERAAYAGSRLSQVPKVPLWVGAVVLVAFLVWPINVVPPSVSNNIDISWITGLHVAAHQGLNFGGDFNYTYGPLGYLTFGNLFYDRTGLPADVISGAIYLATLALVARGACRAIGLIAGGLLVFVAARLGLSSIGIAELLGPLLAAAALLLLRRRDGALTVPEAIGISGLAAFSELTKFSVGGFGLAIVIFVAVVSLLDRNLTRRERVWRAAASVLGFVVALVVLWLLAGESLSDLGAYLRNSVDIVGGYGDATAQEPPGLGWAYWLAGISVLVVAVAVVRDGVHLRWITRIGMAAIWLVFVWVSFLHGFVRLAPGHAAVFFAALLAVVAAVLLGPGRWRLGLLACIAPIAANWHGGNFMLSSIFTVSSAPAVQQVHVLVNPSLRHAIEGSSLGRLRSSYGFPPRLVDRLRGQTVHFDPYESAIAWAYPEFRWRPAPVFQSYVAYTARLDDLNADFLAGSRAPRYVLRENVAVDYRNPRFDSPRYMLELMCRYRQVLRTPRWQLLERGASRCGAPQTIATRRLRLSQRSAVPPPTPDSILVAEFRDFSLPLTDRLSELVFKRRVQFVWLGTVLNRFIPGHAQNPHVMTVPRCLGWSRTLFDGQPYRRLAIGHMPELTRPNETESGSYQVVFRRIPFACGSARGAGNP